jgi:hypothetical protein
LGLDVSILAKFGDVLKNIKGLDMVMTGIEKYRN